ncbi:YciI family protein [Myxococcus stipitatus]|uniref:YciI family protein n=1 Tax=Myxococcus stipitatus TaxID=83455 RepID=UPI0030CDDD79
MRFMVMHKVTEEMESGAPPEPAVMEGVGRLMGEAMQKGIFVSGEGLQPTSKRLHVTYKKGLRTITQGPFASLKERVAGFTLMCVRSKDEALAWCDKFAAAVGDVELVLGAVTEPWDLGMGPKPENAPLRFLSLHMADERSEKDLPREPWHAEKLKVLLDEMTRLGVLQVSGELASTRRGARIHFEGAAHNVIDGPFAESKELVAGYAILDLPSKAEAVEWSVRFGDVVKVREIEVRQLVT